MIFNMHIKLLSLVVASSALMACQKPTEDANAESISPNHQSRNAQLDTPQQRFAHADEKISYYLDQLDSANTTLDVKQQVLCIDYPNEYKNNYIPAMLEIAPQEYTTEKMLNDLHISQDYYAEKLSIQCPK